MKAKLLFILPLLLLSYFFLVPHVSDNAHAIDICQRAGLKTKCSDDKKSVMEPAINPANIAPWCAIPPHIGCSKDSCKYETHKCDTGQSCQASGDTFACAADPNLKDNQSCTCNHSGSTKEGENGQDCTVNGQVQKNAKYCGKGQACTNDANKVAKCTERKCTCVKPNESPDMTCDGNSKLQNQDLNKLPKQDPQLMKLLQNNEVTKCSDEQVCIQQGPGQATCQAKTGTCKCTNPGKKGDKKNGYKCTKPGDPKAGKEEFCPDKDSACTDTPGSSDAEHKHPGISCGDQNIGGDEEGKPTLPPPPSPPCAKDAWKDDQCGAMLTALGNIPTQPEQFLSKLFGLLLSLSGGVALLLIIKAGYQLMTSQGNPEKLQGAREQLVAAIVGLLFLIFSFVLLQVIGVDILKIPTDQAQKAPAGGNASGGDNQNPPKVPGAPDAGKVVGQPDTLPTAVKNNESKGSFCVVNGSGQGTCPGGMTCQVANAKNDCVNIGSQGASCAGKCQ